MVLTGAADDTAKLWDCELGKELRSYPTNSAIRTCNFSQLGNLFMFSTEERRDVRCEILVYDSRVDESAISRFAIDGPPISASVWGPLDETIITGHTDGSVSQYDFRVSLRFNPLFGLKVTEVTFIQKPSYEWSISNLTDWIVLLGEFFVS